MLDNLLANLKPPNGSILANDGTKFMLDINTAEQHNSKLRVTENPIEQGANIADHAVLDPQEITISGVVVSYETSTYSIDTAIGYDLSTYPLPFEVKKATAQIEGMVNKVSSSVKTVQNNATNVIADFLPTYQTPKLFNISGNRIADALTKLLALQRSGEPVEIRTTSGNYKNCMITSVSLTQQNVNHGEFSLTYKEIFIVETQKGTGLKVKSRNLGTTQPAPLTSGNSVLEQMGARKGLDSILGMP